MELRSLFGLDASMYRVPRYRGMTLVRADQPAPGDTLLET